MLYHWKIALAHHVRSRAFGKFLPYISMRTPSLCLNGAILDAHFSRWFKVSCSVSRRCDFFRVGLAIKVREFVLVVLAVHAVSLDSAATHSQRTMQDYHMRSYQKDMRTLRSNQ